MFFTYVQNNSGGRFTFDPTQGISRVVIVEADDWQHADYRAGRIGLYFDGAGDCGCCGSRWDSAQWGGAGTDHPTVYGLSLADWSDGPFFAKLMGEGLPEAFVHLADGRFAGFVYGKRGSYRLTETMEVGQ